MVSILSGKLKESIQNIDPDRIYVENIRSVLTTNTRLARYVCELAFRKGYFKKYYAISCKNDSCGRVIKVYEFAESLPENIICEMCKDDGASEYLFNVDDFNVDLFYKYVSGSYSYV
jgi:hypothetical protein